VIPTLYGLFALGGASALVYEVLWMRSFRLVFGSSTRSAAAVLAAYFAGMALGNWIGAKLARRGRPVRLYGLCELGVGLSALLVAPWLSLFDSLYPGVYAWAGARPALLALAKLGLAGLALAPPAIAMGATLPLASRAVVTRTEHVARRTGLLYAANVLGATAGALLAAFVLPIALGVRSSVHLAVVLNAAIGIAALRLSARGEAATGAPPRSAAPLAQERPAPALLVAAAVSGFGTLALEVVFVRLLSQRSEASVYTYGLLLAIFLLFLALGSLWVSRRLDRADPWRFLAWTQAAAALAILLSPYLFELIPLLGLYSKEDTLAVRLLRFGAGSLFVLGPPVCLAAVVLPSTWKLAVRSASATGEQVGILAAANTLAGVAGSLATGFVLLPRLGLGGSVLFVAALYASLAVAACVQAFAGARRLAAVAACLAIPLAWWALGAWRLVLQPLEPGQRLLRYEDGETATVAVLASRDGHRLLTLNHAYLLGSTAAGEREVQQGRLPLLLHPRPARVAFVGVATGMTASAVLDFPVERAVAIEIVPGVVDVLPDFAPWNRAFFRDPRVELVVADGRNHLRGTRERFDVVIGDLFVPWHAGTGDLYAREHFEAVSERLAPGGLFAQWLAAYQLTPDELRTIAATFLAVFPHATLWRSDFHAEQPLLALVGRPGGARLDPQALVEACRRLAVAREPAAPFLASPSSVRLLYVAGDAALRAWAKGAPLNTDDRPRIEYGSPRSVFEQRQRALPVHRLLAGFGADAASDGASLPLERPEAEVVRAAELLQQATLAQAEYHFEREWRLLSELTERSADLRGVAAALVAAAARYRERGMTERSQALLAAVVATPQPPLGALLALAEARRAEGRGAEAAELLERALGSAPEAEPVRRSLAELLLEAEDYARAELHLRRLLEREAQDAGLRVDLAYALDRQGRRAEAAVEVARVRALPDLATREKTFRDLERRGLGSYLDSAPPD
jgi:spermidine synthase